MIAIAAAVRLGQEAENPDLKRFLATAQKRLAHRDCQASTVERPELAVLTLAPAQSSPPIISTESIQFFFDGRLDNRDELRSQLDADRGTEDARLALKLYQRFGEDGFRRIQGPFAILLIEPASHRVLIARDVIGGRTLYYSVLGGQGGWLVIASEPQGVLACPGVSTNVDQAALAHYFSVIHSAPPGTTFFSQVQEAKPGHCLRFQNGAMTSRRIRKIQGGRISFRSDQEAVDRFRSRFQTAVQCRMPPEGPVAVLMSGGLDSTAVAATAASIGAGSRPIVATSWVFDDTPESNERTYMEAVVAESELDWVPIPADQRWPLRDIEDWPHDPNSPYESPYSSLLHRSLDAAAQKQCPVLLNGEYGDQLFSGVNYWLRDLISEGRLATAFGELMGEWRRGQSLRSALGLAVLGRPLRGHQESPPPHWMTAEARASLAGGSSEFSGYRRPAQWRLLADPLNAMLQSLSRRGAAGYGIEHRRPYCDLQLIELMLQMPSHLFRRGGLSKWILREATRGLLPDKTRLRTWGSTMAPLVARGLFEKESVVVNDLLWSSDRHWPRYIREDWMRNALVELEAGAPDGPHWVVPWLAITFEIWRRREAIAEA